MALNYANKLHLPVISSSAVCADHHDVNNLVNQTSLLSNNGFVCESFVKPPVEVDLVLQHPIELCCLRLGLRNGSQKTEGLVVSVRYLKRNKQLTEFKTLKSVYDIKEDYLNFVNPNYSPNRRLPPFQISNFNSLQVNLRQLNPNSFKNVSVIKIKIFRTERTKVPCLSQLQVWGRPVSEEHLQCVLKQLPPVVRNTPSRPVADDIEQDNDHLIPDEFLDPICCTLMRNPVLLPCGKNIDIETLNKHISVCLSSGHPPNDPFTNLPLTNTQCLNYNTSLKTRLEIFTSRNPEILQKNQMDIPLGYDAGAVSHPAYKVRTGLLKNYSSHPYQIPTKVSSQASETKIAKPPTDYMRPLARTLPATACTHCLTFNTNSAYFNLPCRHIVCRPCISKKKQDLQCLTCSMSYKPSQVERIHF